MEQPSIDSQMEMYQQELSIALIGTNLRNTLFV